MHVFLTGPVQIGKSTLLRASLDALQPQKLGGFRTVSAQPQADGSRPVYLHPACSPDELHESANRIGIRRPGSASSPSRPHSRQRASPRWRAQRTAIFF